MNINKNEMEITRKLTAKVVAQYIGQPASGQISGKGLYMSFLTLGDLALYERNKIDNICVVLRPILSITIEDSIEILKIIDDSNIDYTLTEYVKDGFNVICKVESPNNKTMWLRVDDDGDIMIARGSAFYRADYIQVLPIHLFQAYEYLKAKGYDLPNHLL